MQREFVVADREASASHTQLSVEKPLVVGGDGVVSVQLFDAHGERLTSGGAAVTAFGAQSGALTPRTVTDAKNGTYRVAVGALATAEPFKLDVKLNGVSTAKAPVALPVAFAAPVAARSAASGDGLARATVGEQAQFRVQLRDARNVAVPLGSAALTATLAARGANANNGAARATVAFADAKDGVSASYTAPTLAGSYALRVQLDGAEIAGSPFAVTIDAAATSAAHCSVSGPALAGAVENQPTSLAVRLADRYGNARAVTSEKLQCSAKTASGGAVGVSVARAADGQSVATFTPPVDGPLTLDVLVDGTVRAVVHKRFALNLCLPPPLSAYQGRAVQDRRGHRSGKDQGCASRRRRGGGPCQAGERARRQSFCRSGA